MDYTPREVKACWYDEHESHLIMQECLKVIKKMQEGKPINGRKYCVRGLDRFAPEAADRRELNKMKAYIAVLEEQNNQLRDGHCDPQAIARRYRAAASKRCQLKAQNVGERDALFVQKLLDSCALLEMTTSA
jgi:cell division protein FtsB